MKIGLEVHCQLLTKSKLFCGCPNITAKEPNSVVCDYCIGLPGTKPRINKKAVDFAIQAALALNCKIAGETFFSRKSYFYPDMAKNFQISQFEIPLAKNGWLKTGKKKIRITRLHMEEDPARIVHVGSITEAKYVLVDYNRSGTPLCEIVTAPDFTSPNEARQFLQELSSILEYLGIFDPNLEGSMRVDSNISLDKNDMKEAKGIRVEIKNITGFKDVELALNYEIIRQKNMLRTGKEIVRETRAWDAAAGVTRSLRVKEEEEDYGYIFEGDLPKLTISKEKITEIKKHLPELASQKIRRYEKQFSIPYSLSVSITSEPDLADIFEQVIKEIDPMTAANFFAKELKKTLNFRNLRIKDIKLQPGHIIKLLKLVINNEITIKTAEFTLREMVLNPEDPEEMLKKKTMTMIVDEKTLDPIITKVISNNYRALVDYRTGKKEAFDFLVGQVMRETKGRGDPAVIRKLLGKRI